MNRVLSAPARAAGAGLRAIGALARGAGRGITLIPTYLAGLLWLLSQQFLDLARQGYGGNAAVYACLRLLSTAVPEPPLIAYQQQGDERGDPLPPDHPLTMLLRAPNALCTQYEWVELITLHLAIVGRSCWWKERSNDGRLLALWPLRPDRVGPVYSTDQSEGQQVIRGWSYLVPGTTHYTEIPRSDVLFLNLPDPAGESGGLVEGLGPLQVLAAEVGVDNEATRFVGAVLANSGQPGMVITTEGALPDQATVDAIKLAARQEFSGIKRGSPAVLDAKTKITPFGFSLKDLEFPALRRVSESRISAAVGVPAVLVGLQVGIENGQAYAALQAQREYLAETTLATYWRRISDAVSRDVASEFDTAIVCAFDTTKVKALQHQAKAEQEKITRGFELGAVTIDELREKVLGLPPLPTGGNIRLLPRGVIQVHEDGTLVDPLAGAPANEGQVAQLGMAPEPTPPASQNGHQREPVAA